MQQFTIRKVALSDLDSVSSIHKKAFPGFFLSEMGTLFLKQYYRLIIDYDRSVFIVADGPNGIVGFAAGFASPLRFYSKMSRSKLSFLVPILAALLRRPRLLKRLMHNSRSVTSGSRLTGDDDSKTCELSSIAVVPSAGGQGVGRALLSEFISSSSQIGCKMVTLTTDKNENSDVNKFYTRNGFVLHDIVNDTGDRPMNFFRFEIQTYAEVK